MDYRILLREENEAVRERLELSLDRIRSIKEEDARLPYGLYFKRTAGFLGMIRELLTARGIGEKELPESWEKLSLEELSDWNHRLYEDILPEIMGRALPILIMRQTVWGRNLALFYPSLYRTQGLHCVCL